MLFTVNPLNSLRLSRRSGSHSSASSSSSRCVQVREDGSLRCQRRGLHGRSSRLRRRCAPRGEARPRWLARVAERRRWLVCGGGREPSSLHLLRSSTSYSSLSRPKSPLGSCHPPTTSATRRCPRPRSALETPQARAHAARRCPRQRSVPTTRCPRPHSVPTTEEEDGEKVEKKDLTHEGYFSLFCVRLMCLLTAAVDGMEGTEAPRTQMKFILRSNNQIQVKKGQKTKLNLFYFRAKKPIYS